MRFNPENKDEDGVLPAGEYDFEIIHSDEKTSSNANDMIVLKLKAGTNGTSKIVTDYILAKQVKKVRQVAKACDLLDLFESGEIQAENFLGRKGRVKLIIEKSRDYPDRNRVSAYLSRKQG